MSYDIADWTMTPEEEEEEEQKHRPSYWSVTPHIFTGPAYKHLWAVENMHGIIDAYCSTIEQAQAKCNELNG